MLKEIIRPLVRPEKGKVQRKEKGEIRVSLKLYGNRGSLTFYKKRPELKRPAESTAEVWDSAKSTYIGYLGVPIANLRMGCAV